MNDASTTLPCLDQSDKSVDKDSVLQRYDAVSQGNRIPTFRDNIMASNSGVEVPKNTYVVHALPTILDETVRSAI